MQATMPGVRMRGRPRTAWMDNINSWTGLPVEESIRMTDGRSIPIQYFNINNPAEINFSLSNAMYFV